MLELFKMTIVKNTYTISKIQQLVDLNTDLVNFKINFKIYSLQNLPFEALIVNQSTLDTEENIQFKKVQGSLTGEIISDKNMFQNYFLIMKSETPMAVEVELDIEKLPDYIEPPGDGGNNYLQENNIKYLIVGFGVLVLIFLILKFNSKDKNILPKSNVEKFSLLEKLKRLPIE